MGHWDNKRLFKEICMRHKVSITKYYGITSCNNQREFLKYTSKKFSIQGHGMCGGGENYMPYDSIIIPYTLGKRNGYFCGISNKKSREIQGDGS